MDGPNGAQVFIEFFGLKVMDVCQRSRTDLPFSCLLGTDSVDGPDSTCALPKPVESTMVTRVRDFD